jgi:cold shock CspA family protein
MTHPRGGPGAPRVGAVTEFDDPRGLGVVRSDDGETFPFHCTAIADGSRTVEVGTRVVFTVAPGHRGRYEARSVTTLSVG